MKDINIIKIEDTRELFFNDSKEKYLAFRQAWKDYLHAGKAKPQKCNHYGDWKDGNPYNYMASNLNGAHHLLYVMMIGRDGMAGFKNADMSDYSNFDTAIRSVLQSDLKYLSIPFGDTLTTEMLSDFRAVFRPMVGVKQPISTETVPVTPRPQNKFNIIQRMWGMIERAVV